MNGAESLVHSLIASDVEVCFTNPGTSEMHFVAALDHIAGMRSVLALFEGVATGAADGYFRMARKPACTLLHLGPGLANGMANLHNARKAGSGVVNIVGEHAESHIRLDAPLCADIEGMAGPVSHWVHTSKSAEDVGRDGAAAVTAARSAPGQVATLMLPSDTAWSPGGPVTRAEAGPARAVPDTRDVEAAATVLRQGGEVLLLLGGEALTEANLARAGRIAARTGCGLLSEWSNARMERGAGRVAIGRVPYPIDAALDALAPYAHVVLVGARAPIGFFAYPGKPAELTRPQTQIHALADWSADLDATLAALEAACDAGAETPAHLVAPAAAPMPDGANTPASIAAALAASLPENAIVVDESITSGRNLMSDTLGTPPHTWINNMGGSIGYSLPVAIGAAMACPDRKVLALTGDGSAMYTPQALWTMAREGLDITVVILANRSYRILRGELTNVGVQNPGPRAIDMLSLDRPVLDFVSLARGMGVAATRAEDAATLARAMQAGLASDGPTLIEAVL